MPSAQFINPARVDIKPNYRPVLTELYRKRQAYVAEADHGDVFTHLIPPMSCGIERELLRLGLRLVEAIEMEAL